ncbi:hypothetical protein TURU_061065 [Turdus rufiventris]|nr:hypothetical protein TURU_061065 [Turdus rufiventris]
MKGGSLLDPRPKTKEESIRLPKKVLECLPVDLFETQLDIFLGSLLQLSMLGAGDVSRSVVHFHGYMSGIRQPELSIPATHWLPSEQ